jgi:hypothetical protein
MVRPAGLVSKSSTITVSMWLHNIQEMSRLHFSIRAVAEVISAKQQALGQDCLLILFEGGVDVGLTLGRLLDYAKDAVGFSPIEAKTCSIVV